VILGTGNRSADLEPYLSSELARRYGAVEEEGAPSRGTWRVEPQHWADLPWTKQRSSTGPRPSSWPGMSRRHSVLRSNGDSANAGTQPEKDEGVR
jgi:hypothetical protein